MHSCDQTLFSKCFTAPICKLYQIFDMKSVLSESVSKRIIEIFKETMSMVDVKPLTRVQVIQKKTLGCNLTTYAWYSVQRCNISKSITQHAKFS